MKITFIPADAVSKNTLMGEPCDIKGAALRWWVTNATSKDGRPIAEAIMTFFVWVEWDAFDGGRTRNVRIDMRRQVDKAGVADRTYDVKWMLPPVGGAHGFGASFPILLPVGDYEIFASDEDDEVLGFTGFSVVLNDTEPENTTGSP